MTWYVLDVNPEPWAVGPVQVFRKGNHLGGTVGRNQQLAAYQEAIKEALADYKPEMIVGDVDLSMYFYRWRAEYQTHQARTAHKNVADGTNMFKATEDALQGILFKNDRDVRHCNWFIMEQGPEVVGKIVINCEPLTRFNVAFPVEVWLKLKDLNLGAAKETDQEWGGKEKDLPF